jgi:hypothetical protein
MKWAFPVACWCILGAALCNRAPAAEMVAPPVPPMPASPTQFFRDLLATNEVGRAASLASKNPEQRRILEQKLQEYLALNPDQRELKLTLTDLRYYLMALLRAPLPMRELHFAQLPEKYRPLIAERLRVWDRLPQATQQELLTNEASLSYLVRLDKASPLQGKAMLAALPAEKRQQMEVALSQWRALPADQQQDLTTRFGRFFELTEKERQQTLAVLPADLRRNNEQMLAALARLPKEQRERCMSGLEKFLTLSQAEREQFLQNAARWQAMSTDQRKTMRDSVMKFPPMPPMPPGFFGVPITAVPTNRPSVQ